MEFNDLRKVEKMEFSDLRKVEKMEFSDLRKEKEEFEKYMIETYQFPKSDFEKDDWGSYMNNNVRYIFIGWRISKRHTRETNE